MKITCELNGRTCELPDFMVHFFSKKSLTYCSTISIDGKPYIQPIVFVNEEGKCAFSFLVDKKSQMTKNLLKNPNLTFTIDETHPINPFWNSGIMIKAVSELSETHEEIRRCYENLQKKYSSDVITKILGIDAIQKSLRLKAVPIGISYWKGPFYKKFRCTRKIHRKNEKTLTKG